MSSVDRVGVPPLVCEVILNRPLRSTVERFRAWVDRMGALTVEALLASRSIESCDELFDGRLWEGGFGTGDPPRVKPTFRRLSRRAWANVTSTADLLGFGANLRPKPHVPGAPGELTSIHLESAWYDHQPNWVSWCAPARFVEELDREWIARVVSECTSLAADAGAHLGCVGRMAPAGMTRYSLGTVDWSTDAWRPAWGMLLGAGHVARLGGLNAVDASGLFEQVITVPASGGELYWLQSTEPLLGEDIADPHPRERVRDFYKPILLPPPFDPASVSP